MADADLGDDVEGAATGERHGQLGERLEAAAETGRRPADALGDGLELAACRRDQGQDAVRLAQVEPGQDDGVGRVAPGDGHGTTVPPLVDPFGGGRRITGRCRCGRVPAPASSLSSAPLRCRQSGYLQRTRFAGTLGRDDDRPARIDLGALIADTEAEIVASRARP